MSGVTSTLNDDAVLELVEEIRPARAVVCLVLNDDASVSYTALSREDMKTGEVAYSLGLLGVESHRRMRVLNKALKEEVLADEEAGTGEDRPASVA